VFFDVLSILSGFVRRAQILFQNIVHGLRAL
jgi:hypothetical protein